jgi:hypothetical protein
MGFEVRMGELFVPSLRDLVPLWLAYPGLTSWAIVCRPSGAGVGWFGLRRRRVDLRGAASGAEARFYLGSLRGAEAPLFHVWGRVSARLKVVAFPVSSASRGQSQRQDQHQRQKRALQASQCPTLAQRTRKDGAASLFSRTRSQDQRQRQRTGVSVPHGQNRRKRTNASVST